MPYQWSDIDNGKKLEAWRHRSLTQEGFRWFIGSSVALIAFPLLALIGTPALFVILAMFSLAIAGVWIAILLHYRKSGCKEVLTLEPQKVDLCHVSAGQKPKKWSANPYWVTTHLQRDHKIRNYLTLRGGPRPVELGAFLTPEERVELYQELNLHLYDLAQAES